MGHFQGWNGGYTRVHAVYPPNSINHSVYPPQCINIKERVPKSRFLLSSVYPPKILPFQPCA